MTASFHFYDAILAGRNPAEGQLVHYDSIICNGTGPGEATELSVSLRDNVHVDLEAAANSELAFRDLAAGVDEYEWAVLAHEHFTKEQLLHIGLGNTTRIDPFVRFALYRNLLPYPSTTMGADASYLDLETVARAVHQLRPEEYPWPTGPDPVRGQDLHHFLMWDLKLAGGNRAARVRRCLVELYQASPRLVEHALKLASIGAMKSGLGLDEGEVSDLESSVPSYLTHSSIFGRRGLLLGMPLAVDLTYPDILYVADLESDLSEICAPSTDAYHDFVRMDPADLSKPLVRVPLGRFPFCAPLGVIRPGDAARLQISIPSVKANIAKLRANPFLPARLRENPLLEIPPQSSDIYHRMWAGDFEGRDISVMNRIRQAAPKDWLALAAEASDGRIMELAVRLVNRLSPGALSTRQTQSCEAYSRSRAPDHLEVPLWIAGMAERTDDGQVKSSSAVGLNQLLDRSTRNHG